MKHLLLLALLLFGKPLISQENLQLFKSFPTSSCLASGTDSHPVYYKCLDPKTNQIGVALSDTTLIIPPEYKDVKLVSFAYSCIDNEAYFMAENHQGRYELFQLDGSNNMLLPELHFSEPFQTLAHIYQRKSAPLLYATHYVGNQNQHLLLDRKTGKSSRDYLRIESLGNFFVGYAETGIDLVDTNLHTISSIPIQGKFSIDVLDSKRFEFDDYSFYEPDYHSWEYHMKFHPIPFSHLFYSNYDYRKPDDAAFLSRLFGCAVITYQDQPTKRQMRKGLYEIKRKQLLHLASGKTSPAIYQEVHRIVSEKEVYYWALKDTSGQKQVFDVYNEQLEYLRSPQISSPEKFHEFGLLSHYPDYEQYENYAIPGHPAFYLENPQGKLAILHHNGERLTDFVWDKDQKVTYEGMKKDSTPVFLFCKDTTSFGILLDKNNVPLFGNEYASVGSLGGQKFYSYRKPYKGKPYEFKIVSSRFEVLLDSVQGFYALDPSLLNTGEAPYQLYKNQENRIFIFISGKVSPLYPAFFRQPAARNRISKSDASEVLFVDEQGYLLSEESSKK